MFLVVTGGSGSGKSEFAEKWLLEHGRDSVPRYYIAAMLPYGAESAARIERHRKQRSGYGFVTVEHYLDLASVMVPPGADVLVECMSNLVANELYEEGGSRDVVLESVALGIQKLQNTANHLVVVTNEVFSDGYDYGEETNRYMNYLAQVNRMLAERAQAVVESVYGIPVYLKGEPI